MYVTTPKVTVWVGPSVRPSSPSPTYLYFCWTVDYELRNFFVIVLTDEIVNNAENAECQVALILLKKIREVEQKTFITSSIMMEWIFFFVDGKDDFIIVFCYVS